MARYTDAVEWIALNDDNEWLDDECGSPSVAAALVADLFSKDDSTVAADLRRELKRMQRKQGA